MIAKLTLTENETKDAVREYLQSRGYQCLKVDWEVSAVQDYYENETGVTVRAAADVQPKPVSNGSCYDRESQRT